MDCLEDVAGNANECSPRPHGHVFLLINASRGYLKQISDLHLHRAHGSEGEEIGPSIRSAFNFSRF